MNNKNTEEKVELVFKKNEVKSATQLIGLVKNGKTLKKIK
jgi:hypothetical protein